MKKIIATCAFAVLGVVALSSCNKEYTCDCTLSGTVTAKGSDAASACNDAESTVLGISVEDCTPV
ncbi:MAG: hypothetical protein QNK23_13450 [Crocinitomicaceae bacterium]|nr:hypothetical protein [Crocinitomicaceae bacterium]